MPVLRPCLGVEGTPCGELTTSRRCPTHTRMMERTRPSRRVLGRYDTRYLKLRAIAIKRHPWCSVCHHPGSEDNPLTADHRVPLSRGGKNELSNLDVLCRRDNSAKRDRLVAGV
jgi:5-methylcytosine-specific restriction endonuclease McrA